MVRGWLINERKDIWRTSSFGHNVIAYKFFNDEVVKARVKSHISSNLVPLNFSSKKISIIVVSGIDFVISPKHKISLFLYYFITY